MKNNRWFSGSSVAHLFSAAKAELKLNTERRSIDRCVEAIVPCTENSTDFLKNLPSGAYTSMRTVNQTRVFYFQKHMKRLTDSSHSLLLAKEGKHMHEAWAQYINDDDQKLTLLVIESLQMAMKSFHHQHLCSSSSSSSSNTQGEDQEDHWSNTEYRLTVLVNWNEDHLLHEERLTVYAHVGILPTRDPTAPVQVQIAGPPRENAAAKDSEWVTQRQELFQDLAQDRMEDLILVSSTGELVEGTQTNFFLLLDSKTIVTANENILKGTVRDLVLDICQQHPDLHIELRPPQLNEIKAAHGAFLTSTSRLILPITDLYINRSRDESIEAATSGAHRIHFEPQLVLTSLAEEVRQRVVEKSDPVF